MAVNNTQNNYAKMEFPLTIKRQDAFSIDPTEIWPSLEAAQEYAQTNPTAYVGQKLSVVVECPRRIRSRTWLVSWNPSAVRLRPTRK